MPQQQKRGSFLKKTKILQEDRLSVTWYINSSTLAKCGKKDSKYRNSLIALKTN